MERKFQIVGDSACDLSPEEIARLGIELVSYYVSFDDTNYQREGRDIAAETFYAAMAEHPGVYPKTSMPTVEDYLSAFRVFTGRGERVLCICLNSAFSGSFQCACNARAMLLEEDPGAEICVMDSQLATVLQGVLVQEAARLRDEGVDLAEAVARLEAVRGSGRIFFTTNDLDYLAHGGRIGKAAAKTGTLLQMKPMIVYRDCQLHTGGVVRGRKNSLQRCRELFRDYVQGEGLDLSDYIVGTGYGYDREEFDRFCESVTALLQEMGYGHILPRRGHIGVTIGVHTGPYPIGMGLLRRA